MTKRQTNYDRKSDLKSSVCRYRPWENATRRHNRRLKIALKNRHLLARWCNENGMKLSVTNENRQFYIRKDIKLIASWSPSTAKLILHNDHKTSVHAHDYKQVIYEIKRIRP